MTDSIDLDLYFSRIGYRGNPRADLETLSELQRLHAEAIAFENLDPLTGRRVKLDPASLQQKLIVEGRGGYCFEHNGLMQLVLRKIGFDVIPLGARVMWNSPPDTILPRTHSLTCVRIGGESYIVDVGFGSLTPTSPLRLQTGIVQETNHEPMRLVAEGETYVLEALTESTWRPMYRFDLQPQFPADYAMANWYVSTFPESHFVNRLGVARPVPGRRYTLRGAELAIHELAGQTTRTRLESVEELRRALTEIFGIRLPEEPSLDAALLRQLTVDS
ncbi:MAG TPA: arylamine N-acetyltransferase [Steroidobacteraceae bacterium]